MITIYIEDKSRVYNWVARLLLDQVDFSNFMNQISLVLDKSKSKSEIAEFDRYVFSHLKGRIDPKVPLTVAHKDSREDLCLSAVDIFAWGVFRKYEKKDTDWYDVFKEKIRYEDVYLK